LIHIIGQFHYDLGAENKTKKALRKIKPDLIALEHSKFEYNKEKIKKWEKTAKKKDLDIIYLLKYSLKKNVPIKMIDNKFLRILQRWYFNILIPFVLIKAYFKPRIRGRLDLKIIIHPKRKDFEKALKETEIIRSRILALLAHRIPLCWQRFGATPRFYFSFMLPGKNVSRQ